MLQRNALTSQCLYTLISLRPGGFRSPPVKPFRTRLGGNSNSIETEMATGHSLRYVDA